MRHTPLLFAAFLLLLSSCTGSSTEDYASYINPKIGTGGHGHVFVGANVPFGFVQLGPTSIPQDWDWCSGYRQTYPWSWHGRSSGNRSLVLCGPDQGSL